jgi:hypothetical protein
MNRKAFIFALAILLLVGIHACNYHMSLLISGYIGQEISIVSIGIDDNNHEFRVVVKKSQGQYEKTGYFSKNEYGIWQKQYESSEAYKGVFAFSWTRISGIRGYGNMTVQTEWENHIVYCGNNAVRLLPSLNQYLPDNVIVSVNQSQNSYMIHLTFYDHIESIDIYEVLEKTGAVDLE